VNDEIENERESGQAIRIFVPIELWKTREREGISRSLLLRCESAQG